MRFYYLIFILGLFYLYSCSDGIVSECSTDGSVKVNSNFTSIQKNVFNKSCALSGCHSGSFPAANLNLTEGNAYKNIVNVQSTGDYKYILPGNSSESYLFQKISSNETGFAMPPTGKLQQHIIDSIKVWIDNGALNN